MTKNYSVAAAILATALIATPLIPTRSDAKPTLKVGVGLGYVNNPYGGGDELQDYLDETRDEFEPSMPNFSNQLQVSPHLPTLKAEVAWGADDVMLYSSFEFSTSKLFGKLVDKRHYEANVPMSDVPASEGGPVLAIGDTTSKWTQDLGHYANLSGGAEYSPFHIGPVTVGLNIGAGIFSLKSKSSLLTIIEDEIFLKNVPIVTLHPGNIYEVIDGSAETSASGFTVDMGAAIRWAVSEKLEAYGILGYHVARGPMKIKEVTNYDHHTTDPKTISEERNIAWRGDGVKISLGVNWKFGSD